MTFKNKTVLVTGGCSGIGKIMARKALERGASKIIILDRDEAAFPQLQDEWKSFGKPVDTFYVDLADLQQIEEVAARIKAAGNSPDILINNAGIIMGSFFHNLSHDQVEKEMKVNALAPMHLTLAFLPGMIERNSGHIVNVSSSASLISNPKMAVYCGSKWALTGWAESVRLELKKEKRNIGVTTLMPFFISTGMFEGVKSKIIPILNPESTSEKFMRAIEKEKKLYAVPVHFRLLRLAQGLLPQAAFEWAMQTFGIYNTMNDFTGRGK